MENLLYLTNGLDEEATAEHEEDKKTDLYAAATDAFEVSNWIIGLLSGGVEPPRQMLRATALKDRVLVTYTYQNGIYHDKRAGKEFQDTYFLENGTLSILGEDALFPIAKDDIFFDLAEDEITKFCEKHGVKAKGL